MWKHSDLFKKQYEPVLKDLIADSESIISLENSRLLSRNELERKRLLKEIDELKHEFESQNCRLEGMIEMMAALNNLTVKQTQEMINLFHKQYNYMQAMFETGTLGIYAKEWRKGS